MYTNSGSDHRIEAKIELEEAGSGGVVGMAESGYDIDGGRNLSDPSHVVSRAEVVRVTQQVVELSNQVEARALRWKNRSIEQQSGGLMVVSNS